MKPFLIKRVFERLRRFHFYETCLVQWRFCVKVVTFQESLYTSINASLLYVLIKRRQRFRNSTLRRCINTFLQIHEYLKVFFNFHHVQLF